MPQRIQLSRAKGWRKPEGTIVVARPTRWGNPHVVEEYGKGWIVCVVIGRGQRVRLSREHEHWTHHDAVLDAIHLYRLGIEREAADVGLSPVEYLAELRGHDLACWCHLDDPCHADVLLELANNAGA